MRNLTSRTMLGTPRRAMLGPPPPHRFRLLGHAPCGWRWWGDESEPVPVHRCRKPSGRRVPVIEITVVEARR